MGGLLRDMFKQLYDLLNNRFVTVCKMCTLGWGGGEDGWKWRRRLLACEEEQMREYSLLLSNIFLVWSL